MDESRVISCLKGIAAARLSRSIRPEAWADVLRELAEVVEALPTAGTERTAILDKVFWLVLVSEGAALFDV
jgi:hypothetical protein